MPQSKEEYYVALALYRLKLDFEFQKSIGGGTSVRGGQVVDFWVFTFPFTTPVFIQGGYWHNRAKQAEDDIKQQAIQQMYKGHIAENLLIPAEDITDPDTAYSILRRKLL